MIARHLRRSLTWFAPATALALTFGGGCWSRNLPTIFLDGGSNGSGGSFDGSIPVSSGGRSGLCPPWSEMHRVDDAEQRRQMVEGMLAWNTDFHLAEGVSAPNN